MGWIRKRKSLSLKGGRIVKQVMAFVVGALLAVTSSAQKMPIVVVKSVTPPPQSSPMIVAAQGTTTSDRDLPDYEPLDHDQFLGKISTGILDHAFNEHISPFSGTLILNQIDAVLPGNAGLDIVVQRYYTSNIWNRVDNSALTRHVPSADMGDRLGGSGWQMHMGKIINPNPGIDNHSSFVMADGSTHTLYNRSGGGKITEEGWKYDVSGSQTTIRTTDGLTYYFDSAVTGAHYNYFGYDNGAQIVVLECTRVEHLNGNAIVIEYSEVPNLEGYATRIDRISFDDPTDERSVEFSYYDNSNYVHTIQVMDDTTTVQNWTYSLGDPIDAIFQEQYPNWTRYVYSLTYVQPPEGNPWAYTYYPATTDLTAGRYLIESVVSPRASKITYTWSPEVLDTGNEACSEVPEFLAVQTRQTETYNSVDIVWEDVATTTFSYTNGGQEDATTTSITTDSETGNTLKTEEHVFHGWGPYLINDPNMWKVGREKSSTVVIKDDAGNDLETTVTTTNWDELGDVISSDTQKTSGWVACGGFRQNSPQRYARPTSVTRVITRHDGDPDPVTYTTVTSAFDNWSNPGLVSETSDDGLSRTTNLTYWQDPTLNLMVGHVQGNDPDPGGAQCHQYDSLGRLAHTYTNPASDDVSTCSETDPVFGARRVDFAYDANGNLSTKTEVSSPNNRVTTHTNYQYGQPKDTVVTTGTATDIHFCREYGPLGTVTWETDGRGCNTEYRTNYLYDTYGRLTTSTPPIGDPTTFAYVVDWSYVTVTRGGQSIRYVFNRFGALTDIYNDQTNHWTQIENDALGRRRQVALLWNPQWGDTYDYDPLGRITAVTHPGLPQTQVTFDYAGNRVIATDERFHDTIYDHEAFGSPGDRRLVAVTDADTEMTEYGYDPVYGALASINAPISQGDRTFSYVSGSTGCTNGFLESETHPESGTTTYDYNCLGLVTERTRPGSETTTWDYDHAGRVVEITYPNGGGTVPMAYDGAGRRTSLSNASADTTYVYDDAGRLETMTFSIVGGPTNQVFGYTYDALDRLETLTYPSGRVVTLAWDNRNWLTSLTGPDGSGVAYLSDITYLNTGLPDVTTFANGVITNQDMDDRNRLDSSYVTGPGGTLVDMELQYDLASNIEYWIDNLDLSKTRQFGYDTLSRLTSADSGGLWGDLSYTYDELGNRESRTLNGDLTTSVYDTSTNQLTGLTGAEVRGFSYDAAGRMQYEDRTQVTAAPLLVDPDEIFSDGFETGDTRYWSNGSAALGVLTYTFNGADQLFEVKNGTDVLSTYRYDGDGLRVFADNGTEVTYYLRGPGGNTLAEYDDQGSLMAEYLYAGGRQVGKVVPDGSGGDEVSFFHADYLGSAMVITDDVGGVTWSGTYLPFGEPATSTGTPDHYRFTQHELDAETDLYYAKARYYHPHIGRFLSNDPVAGSPNSPQSWNRYSYVLNNPVKLVDPDGKAPRGALEEMSVRSHMSAPQVQNYNTEQAKVEAGYALQWAGVFAPFGPEDAVIGLAIRGGGRALRALGLLGKAAKRGPKPRGVGPHNLKIKEVGDSVTDGQVIAGGQRLPEVLIETQGGIKSGRRPDILVERPDGSSYGINVGKTSKSGAPIKREADAINDLEGAGVEMHYVQYD